MTYIGIDPGKHGAMTIIEDDGALFIIPFDEQNYIDELKDIGIIREEDAICCLEHVGAMPGQGVVSMFSFGENFGFIRGILETCIIPYQLVRPQVWKKEFGITRDKNMSITVAKRLFPNADLKRTPQCRKDDDGIAESLLMAEYARRKLG